VQLQAACFRLAQRGFLKHWLTQQNACQPTWVQQNWNKQAHTGENCRLSRKVMRAIMIPAKTSAVHDFCAIMKWALHLRPEFRRNAPCFSGCFLDRVSLALGVGCELGNYR